MSQLFGLSIGTLVHFCLGKQMQEPKDTQIYSNKNLPDAPWHGTGSADTWICYGLLQQLETCLETEQTVVRMEPKYLGVMVDKQQYHRSVSVTVMAEQENVPTFN